MRLEDLALGMVSGLPAGLASPLGSKATLVEAFKPVRVRSVRGPSG
jgi:hypothetical protein